MVPAPWNVGFADKNVSNALKLLNELVQPFAPGVGVVCAAGHQIGSLVVASASAAACVASGSDCPSAFTTATVVLSGTSLRVAACSAGAASALGSFPPAEGSSAAGALTSGAAGASTVTASEEHSLVVPSEAHSVVVSVGGVSPVVPPSAYTIVGPIALKNKTAMMTNERRDERTLIDMDPPRKTKIETRSSLNYTDETSQSQLRKGYRGWREYGAKREKEVDRTKQRL